MQNTNLYISKSNPIFMINLKYEEIISKIKEKTGKSNEEIDFLVKEKLKKLSDLISKEGAAHIVANELKVKIIDKISGRLKIKNLVAGMGSMDVLGKIIDIYPVREFKTAKREGRIASLLLGDDTGSSRVVIWDNLLIKQAEDNIQKDMVIEVKNAYVKDNNGFKEIHMGNRSSFNLDCDEEVEVNLSRDRELKKISDLAPNDNVKIIGTIVQVFEPRFYEGCIECKKKVELSDGNYKCPVHGNTEMREIPILNVFLDDGSDSIRAVLFDENAKKLVKDIKGNFEDLKNELMGKQVEITGNIKKNEMFDRLEIFTNKIGDVDPERLAEQILEEIKIA